MKSKLLNVKNALAMAAVGVLPTRDEVKRESGDHLLEVLGVIIIAVVLLIFFKDKITALFNSVMGSTETKVNNLWGSM